MCNKDIFNEPKKVHFDVNHMHTVIWESSRMQEAAEELKATVRNTFPSDAILND